jgi:group I intron endonuclease
MTGIYKIINKINKKVYIGESQNIERRWEEHKQDLIEGKHHSYKLQQDYDLYGEDDFEYEVIEELDSNIKSPATRQMVCLIYEDKYIKQCNSIEEGYNIENTLQRILDGKRGVFNEHQINKNHIKMLEGMIEYIKRNNGVYISPEELKKIKKNSTTFCLFQIRNIVLDKSYISRSKYPDKILNDITKKLKRNKYTSGNLQKDFNKYGINNFEFSILEISNDFDYLIEREKEIAKQLEKDDKLYNTNIIHKIIYNKLK